MEGNKILSNKTPKSWELEKINRLYKEDPKNGLWKSMDFYGSGYPIIRINDYDLNGNMTTPDLLRVNVDDNEARIYFLQLNDLLINRVNSLSHIGKVTLVEELNENVLFESNIIRLRFNSEKILPKYAFYYLSSNFGRRQCQRMAKRAVAQASINQQDIGMINVLLPPIIEQIKIVDILSNVDEIIQLTQELIEKLKLLKKGLMQRLFTEGIGHTEFKNTKLGKMPYEWEVVKFNNIASIKHGASIKSTEFSENGIPVVKIADISKNGYIDLSKCQFIPKEKLFKYKDYILKRNNVVMALTGATLGKTGCVQDGLGVLIQNQRVGLFLSKDTNVLSPSYLFYLVQTVLFQRQMWMKINESAQPNIGKKDIEGIKFPLPKNIIEQNCISRTLSNIDNKIMNEFRYKRSLKFLKRGLMQQLLTGRKRVPIN